MTVQVVHPDCTHAEGLVRAAVELRDAFAQSRVRSNREVSKYDHVWVLFDTDVPARDGQLQSARQLAENENIHVGHSTPSVEFWLLLHFRFTTAGFLNSDAVERVVGESWGQHYDKSAETFTKLWPALRPNIQEAISRATQTREHHKAANSSFPPNPSTELDLLARALFVSVRPELRSIR